MINVVIADDSPLLRKMLVDVLEDGEQIKVVGQAMNGKEAVDLVKKLNPDVLILDCEMPVMNGLEALRKVMAECPLPVFMFSSLTSEGAAVTIRALEYGAVDYLLKPSGGFLKVLDVGDELIAKIKFIAIKRKFAMMKKEKKAIQAHHPQTQTQEKAHVQAGVSSIKSRKIEIIAMGSSTGGVQAAMNIIPKLPATIKPIVWVQHMPPNFTKSFAQRLDSVSKITVKEAEDGDILKDGWCYLAPGGLQMKVHKVGGHYKLKVGGTDKVSGHCPSCDVLFKSVSELFSHNSLGVILTGMGEDGTKGLVEMHKKGCFVIGQNENSCVVYGMPKAAFSAGAVDVQLDIMQIADGIVRAGGFQV